MFHEVQQEPPPEKLELQAARSEMRRARAELRESVANNREAFQFTWFEEGLKPPRPKSHRHPEGGIT